MRATLMMLVLAATPALADEWVTLSGVQIKTALTARVLVYADGAQQQFNADGTTPYENPEISHGQWRVTGDQYCSQWPPSDRWSCYDVAQRGSDIRFVASDGSASIGQYADLP
jgi:hypothetical protein